MIIAEVEELDHDDSLVISTSDLLSSVSRDIVLGFIFNVGSTMCGAVDSTVSS